MHFLSGYDRALNPEKGLKGCNQDISKEEGHIDEEIIEIRFMGSIRGGGSGPTGHPIGGGGTRTLIEEEETSRPSLA